MLRRYPRPIDGTPEAAIQRFPGSLMSRTPEPERPHANVGAKQLIDDETPQPARNDCYEDGAHTCHADSAMRFTARWS
jgi:hypothetical protein